MPQQLQWILIERSLGASGMKSVGDILARLERPFLQGGGGVANMLQPRGPYEGAVVEIRSVAGRDASQIIGWGGVDDVGTILRQNAQLSKDLALPDTPAQYYFATTTSRP